MTISLLTLALAIGIAILGMIFLVIRMNAETTTFIKELQFFLSYRTVAHNKAKAKLAVMETRFKKMKAENIQLKKALNNPINDEVNFKSEVGNTQFVEDKSQKIEKLELEISSIERVLNSDIKEQLSSYMDELSGLGQRINQVRMDYTTEVGQSSLENLDPKDIT